MHFTSSLSRAASMLVELSAGWLVVLCTNAAAVRRRAAATRRYYSVRLAAKPRPHSILSAQQKLFRNFLYPDFGLRPRESLNVFKTFFLVCSPRENNSLNSFDENVSKLVDHC